MTKPNEASSEVVRRRKATVWTREKIGQLIELYRQHECLWNHYTEAYKNKDRRNKAIEDICSNLRITKLDFGKKIHNLRNQFNSEMKKLERRVEETGGSPDLCVDTGGCRWKHFDSLRFLRDVIEPRPGGYQSTGFPQAKTKKESRFKLDYASEEDTEQHTNTASSVSRNAAAEDVTEYHFEETNTVDDNEALAGIQGSPDGFQQFETVVEEEAPISAGENYDQKYNPRLSATSGEQTVTITNLTPLQGISTSKKYLAKAHQLQQQKANQQYKDARQRIDDDQHIPSTSIVELATTGNNVRVDERAQLSSPACPLSGKRSADSVVAEFKARDQWDAFGELIASEFRHLNSDTSRKKLKRKIMQAMLEVGEEDDSATT